MAERKTYTAEDLKGCNGRRVLVEGVIDDPSPETTECVRVRFPSFSVMTPEHADVVRSAIVEILPEEIKRGDKVRAGVTVDGVVEHVANGRAWVVWSSGAESVWPLSDLTLVERG